MIGRAAVRAACVAVLAVGVLASPPAAAAAAGPPLSVRAAVLYAPQTGQTLLDVAGEQERPIASTTKLMTALIVLTHVHRLGTVFTMPDYRTAATDSQIGIKPGVRMTVHDLLIAMMLPSADDAAQDLAYNVGHGSIARFVGMMNAEARRLGLRHTHYSTPIGLDTPGNYSTAGDLVRLAYYDERHSPFFARVVRMRSASLATGPVRTVTNLNDLVARFPWITGVKTGHTNGAGYVLVASGHRQSMTLVSAVLGTDSSAARDANSLAVLGYGYGAFHLATLVRAGQVLARPAVKDRPGVHVPVRAARGFTRVVSNAARVRVAVDVPARIDGPLPAGAVVGSAVVYAGGRRLTSVPVVLRRSLPAVSGLTLAVRFITQPLVLVLLVLLAALATTLGVIAVRRGRVGGPGSGGGPGGGRSERDRERDRDRRTRSRGDGSGWEAA